MTEPKGKPRGRKGGRHQLPPENKAVRKNVMFYIPDLEFLKTIHPNLSKAIRQLIHERINTK